MTRDVRREARAVSSSSAARVCCDVDGSRTRRRRSSAASGESAPTPASVSRSGAKNSFSWIARTTRLVRAGAPRRALERGRARAVAEAEDAREAGARVDVGRERVGLLLVDELEPVLDRAQQHVRVVERPASARVDVAAVASCSSASSVVADRIDSVVAAVHELEELHRELDVADAAAAALELAVRRALRASRLPSARAFIARTSRTASGSSTSGQTNGVARAPMNRRRARRRRRPAAP